MRYLVGALLASVLLAPAVYAQDDVEGSKDHPMVSRFPGYFIEDYQDQDFGVYEFDLGGETQRVEGHYWRISYRVKEGAKKAGPLQIVRNYANTFTQRGGTKLVEQADVYEGRLVARLPAAGKNIWMQVEAYGQGEVYSLTILEEAGMEQKVEFTATELSNLLAEKGSVALHGILFDTGKATLKPESEAVLASIGELLTSDPSLQLEIQGHTDNVGSKEMNLKLSKERAAAVKDYLVTKFNVTPDRLTTAGFGDQKPVADNNTEEGRAQNRRVELVKK